MYAAGPNGAPRVDYSGNARKEVMDIAGGNTCASGAATRCGRLALSARPRKNVGPL